MSNNFCRLFTNGYKIRSVGTELYWNACCQHRRGVEINGLDSIKRAQEKFSQVTGWIPECVTCERYELANDEASPRQLSFIRVPEDTTDGDCVDLEISFDTQCNAACMSCSEVFSSTWAKFNQQHGIKSDFPIAGKRPSWEIGTNRDYYQQKYNIVLTEDDVYRSDAFLKGLIAKVPMDKLRSVFILGGEPFYSNTHVKLIQHIRQVHPDISKISLRYQSNGSIFPSDDIIKLWDGFGKLIIGVSIDGIGDRFEWLRWPIPWQRAEKNVKSFIEHTDASFFINNTITPMNLLHWGTAKQWTDDIIPRDRFAFGFTTMRHNPAETGIMRLEKTPLPLREEFVKQYGIDHALSRFVMNLPLTNYHDMVQYCDKIDRLRSLEWRKIFPETASFM